MAKEDAVKDDAHGHGGDAHPKWLQHHFDTPLQQFEAAKFGIWLFLVTEILMFGGLFVAFGIWRTLEPSVFHLAHEHLNKKMGAINTVVLLFSSLTAALAVRSSQLGKKNQTSLYLVITILCAFAFLVVKYFEYTHKLHEGLLPGRCFGYSWCHNDRASALVHETVNELPPRAAMYFAIYFMMTGLHGLHVTIGIGILIWILVRNMRNEFTKEYFTPVDVAALYWHLVDLIWIYLFPLLYLVG